MKRNILSIETIPILSIEKNKNLHTRTNGRFVLKSKWNSFFFFFLTTTKKHFLSSPWIDTFLVDFPLGCNTRSTTFSSLPLPSQTRSPNHRVLKRGESSLTAARLTSEGYNLAIFFRIYPPRRTI